MHSEPAAGAIGCIQSPLQEPSGEGQVIIYRARAQPAAGAGARYRACSYRSAAIGPAVIGPAVIGPAAIGPAAIGGLQLSVGDLQLATCSWGALCNWASWTDHPAVCAPADAQPAVGRQVISI